MSLIRNVLMVLVGLVIGVYLSELGITVYQTLKGYDVRTKYQVVESYKGDAVPAVFPSMFIKSDFTHDNKAILPLTGISNKTTVYCNEGGEYSIYKSDRYGFNNPEYIWDNVIDVALIGDSFVHGACVGPTEGVASQLNEMQYRDKEKYGVLNLGMGGAGPLIEFAILNEYAKYVKPKDVFWFYYEGNDINGLSVEKESSVLRKYNEEGYSQNLFDKQEVIDEILSEYILNNTTSALKKNTRTLRLYNTRKLLASLYASYSSSPVVYSDNDYKEFQNMLNIVKTLVNEWGGKLHFVYLPAIDRYRDNKSDDENLFGRKIVLNMIKELEIPVVDIHNRVMLKVQDPLQYFPYKREMHYNAKGYKEVAKTLYEHLKR